MQCTGNFKFKGLIKRDGGSFTSPDGKVINYKESYTLKLDEQTENGIYERQFKVSIDSPLVAELMALELYDDITLDFDLKIYGSRITVIPIALR